MGFGKGTFNSSEVLEDGDRLIVAETPKREDARIRDPEIFMNRLEEIAEPRERLKEFLKSVFVPDFNQSHESYHIYKSSIIAGAAGWLFGGILRNTNHHEDFVRRNNSFAFKSNFEANRLRLDTYMFNVLSKGIKMGTGCFLLVFSTGVITMGSINYRGGLYLPDWLVGIGTIGAVSRCWLGVRGVVSGGTLGVGAGLFGYGLVRALEKASGESVPEWRYRFHDQYMRKRQAQREQLLRISQENFKDKLG